MGWAYKIAHRWRRSNPSLDLDDVLGAVLLGFVRAGRLYDPSHGAKFTTYAKFWADNQVRRLLDGEDRRLGPRSDRDLREGNPRIQYVSGLFQVHEEGDSDAFLETFPAAPDPEPVETYHWDKAKDSLDAREYSMIRQWVLEERTYAEIAVDYRISRERVRQIVDRGLRKLRSRFEREAAE